jgi:O-antigen ligase
LNTTSNTHAEWAALAALSLSLAAAVALRGGVYPAQWAWSAIGIALALLLVANTAKARSPRAARDVGQWLLGALLAWMVLALVPLPPSLVVALSPERWRAISAARSFTGGNPRAWAALSVAPGATAEGLLDVVPAMAAFFASRSLSVRWRGNKWTLVAPVIFVAWFESLLGMLQFRAMRASGVAASAVTGTYVNRDHFAALLEMTFPLALMWAVALRRHSDTQRAAPVRAALATIGLLGVGACLLLGITFSSSRMGFAATLGAAAFISATLFASRARPPAARKLAWRWVAAIALPACLFISLPTKELLDRYRDLSATGHVFQDARVKIWRDSLSMIRAYKWTGCGLGAFEYGFYRFNSRLPMDTVDFAHNDYLQIAAELGLVGAALASALAVWIVYGVLSVVLYRRADPGWELAVGLLGALIAIGLHSLTDFNLYIPANAFVLAWFSGIADSFRLRLRPDLSA